MGECQPETCPEILRLHKVMDLLKVMRDAELERHQCEVQELKNRLAFKGGRA